MNGKGNFNEIDTRDNLYCTFPEENVKWCLQWQNSLCCTLRTNNHVCTVFLCWDMTYTCVCMVT